MLFNCLNFRGEFARKFNLKGEEYKNFALIIRIIADIIKTHGDIDLIPWQVWNFYPREKTTNSCEFSHSIARPCPLLVVKKESFFIFFIIETPRFAFTKITQQLRIK